ncbi:cytochrome P450 [Xylariales sp. PMI_506]|nr:cytochrome P450 [Xylariales sp. PMI_506]
MDLYADFQFLWRALSLSLSLAGITLGVYVLGNIFYDLFFHPLRKYPGPLLCRISKLPWDYWQLTGQLQRQVFLAHSKYGDAVRIAPDELSFASHKAWEEIFAYNRNKQQWPRNPKRVPRGRGNKGPMSLVNTPPHEHARFRRVLNYAFSDKGLQEQEKLITGYIDIFVERMMELAKKREVADVTKWYSMLGFDIISDLGWHEPFHCVENRQEHSWIRTLAWTAFDSQLKIVFRERGLLFLAPWFVPMRLQKARITNFMHARQRIEERISQPGARGDFWDKVLVKGRGDVESPAEGLTHEEMVVTAVTLVGTGSETISTMLSGVTYFLGRNPRCMSAFVGEIRKAFSSPAEITMLSTRGLQYMNACIEETMRLYPPVIGLLWRVPPQGGGVVGGKFIPEGTSVNVNMFAMFQNPAHFHRPSEFVPERWLPNAPSEFAKDCKAAFRPFSVGTMNCLGQNLANAEGRLILAKMFWHLDLKIDTKTSADWLDQKSWTVYDKKPLYVEFIEAVR